MQGSAQPGSVPDPCWWIPLRNRLSTWARGWVCGWSSLRSRRSFVGLAGPFRVYSVRIRAAGHTPEELAVNLGLRIGLGLSGLPRSEGARLASACSCPRAQLLKGFGGRLTAHSLRLGLGLAALRSLRASRGPGCLVGPRYAAEIKSERILAEFRQPLSINGWMVRRNLPVPRASFRAGPKAFSGMKSLNSFRTSNLQRMSAGRQAVSVFPVAFYVVLAF